MPFSHTRKMVEHQSLKIRQRIWLSAGFVKSWMKTSKSGRKPALSALRREKAEGLPKEMPTQRSKNKQNNQMIVLLVLIKKTQKNQPARLMTPRKATGSGLDAIVCLRPTWQQNFGICEKPGWKMLWWLLRWKKRCATKRSTHGAMLSACSIRRQRSTLQRLQSGKKLTSKIKEIGLTEKRRAETTF